MKRSPLFLQMHKSAPAALALCAVLALAACGPAKPDTTQVAEARRVKTTTVEQGPASADIEVPGVGAFRDETRLSFKVGGVIERITVREGDTVKAGQKLAWLDKQEVNAAVAQAQAAHDKALRDLQRGEQLRKEEVISKVQLQNLNTAAQLSRAQLTQAQFASATAEVSATADGVVLKRFAQVGEVVAPGQPVLLLGSRSSGFVLKASLADRQAVHIAVGNSAEVVFDALPGTRWPGKVIEQSQAADPATGTYGVLVQLDPQAHPGLNLLSGMQGRARIQPNNTNSTRSYVPIEAVVEGNNKNAWMYVLQADNTVKRQAVQIAFVAGARVALQEPLPEGTKVVSTGAPYLQDGETVQVVE
ncbi:efflux RND transporter periplasmic adaptor subunit [Limnobacter sp.]|uniref:efflux RND transporter periplasmic adaptor subunit n=1 Tax=Limnobacter sp. TaxID=2003368 RepID=UPI003511F228